MNEHDEMSRDDYDRMRVFGLGLVLGAVAGAAAGLLMAPASGEETRRSLRRGARHMYHNASGAIEDTWKNSERRYRKLRKNGVRRARKQAERAREFADDVIGSGKKRFSFR